MLRVAVIYYKDPYYGELTQRISGNGYVTICLINFLVATIPINREILLLKQPVQMLF